MAGVVNDFCAHAVRKVREGRPSTLLLTAAAPVARHDAQPVAVLNFDDGVECRGQRVPAT